MVDESIRMTVQDCIDRALATEKVQEQGMWLERALDIDPEVLGKVIRVAKLLETLSVRPSGRDYIAELEKLEKERKETRPKSRGQ